MSSKILASIGRRSSVLEVGCREGCSYKMTRGRQSTSLAALKRDQELMVNPSIRILNAAPVPSWDDLLLNGRIIPLPESAHSRSVTRFHLPIQLNAYSNSNWRVGDPFKFLEEETSCNSHLMASTSVPSNSDTVRSSLNLNSQLQNEQKEEPSSSEKPNMDQLQKLHSVLENSLSKLFSQPMDYSIYHPEVLFIDNLRNKTTQGIMKYVQQVALLRAVGHFKFAYVKFDVLNSNISVEESRITIRWRIRGISGLRVMLKFWKIRLWDWKDVMNQQENWYDGISHFDIGSDCLVHRHTADKMMEDKDREVDVAKHTGKSALAAKLGVLAALFPNPSLTFFRKSDPQSFVMENSGIELHK